jgi:hypothetical protein
MNNNTFVSKVKTAALSLVFAASLSSVSFAKGTTNNAPVKETSNAKTFNVNYIGAVEDGYIFNIKYDNLTSNDFDLAIKDETGEIIYQRSFSDKNFNRKFQLSKSLIKAVFILRPAHANEQSVEVAIQSRTTEDVVISRM